MVIDFVMMLWCFESEEMRRYERMRKGQHASRFNKQGILWFNIHLRISIQPSWGNNASSLTSWWRWRPQKGDGGEMQH